MMGAMKSSFIHYPIPGRYRQSLCIYKKGFEKDCSQAMGEVNDKSLKKTNPYFFIYFCLWFLLAVSSSGVNEESGR